MVVLLQAVAKDDRPRAIFAIQRIDHPDLGIISFMRSLENASSFQLQPCWITWTCSVAFLACSGTVGGRGYDGYEVLYTIKHIQTFSVIFY
jgi:hypothetical protein